MNGALIVIEGPDGTGKSTVINGLSRLYQQAGISSRIVCFPGRDIGSLGALVYQLHHRPIKLGVSRMTATALQAMHIAAHLDAIETTIIPFLSGGGTVLMDRFWWSTWVYGTVANVDSRILENLISVEKAAWGKHLPAHAILLDRKLSLRNEDADNWSRIRMRYHQLCEVEKSFYPVNVVSNESQLGDALNAIWRIVNGEAL